MPGKIIVIVKSVLPHVRHLRQRIDHSPVAQKRAPPSKGADADDRVLARRDHRHVERRVRRAQNVHAFEEGMAQDPIGIIRANDVALAAKLSL